MAYSQYLFFMQETNYHLYSKFFPLGLLCLLFFLAFQNTEQNPRVYEEEQSALMQLDESQKEERLQYIKLLLEKERSREQVDSLLLRDLQEQALSLGFFEEEGNLENQALRNFYKVLQKKKGQEELQAAYQLLKAKTVRKEELLALEAQMALALDEEQAKQQHYQELDSLIGSGWLRLFQPERRWRYSYLWLCYQVYTERMERAKQRGDIEEALYASRRIAFMHRVWPEKQILAQSYKEQIALYQEQGAYEQAEELILQAQEALQEDAKSLLEIEMQRINVLLQKKEYKQAFELLTHTRTLRSFETINEKQKRQLAVLELEAALGLGQKPLAQKLRAAGDFGESLTERMLLARYHLLLGERAEAKKRYEQILYKGRASAQQQQESLLALARLAANTEEERGYLTDYFEMREQGHKRDSYGEELFVARDIAPLLALCKINRELFYQAEDAEEKEQAYQGFLLRQSQALRGLQAYLPLRNNDNAPLLKNSEIQAVYELSIEALYLQYKRESVPKLLEDALYLGECRRAWLRKDFEQKAYEEQRDSLQKFYRLGQSQLLYYRELLVTALDSAVQLLAKQRIASIEERLLGLAERLREEQQAYWRFLSLPDSLDLDTLSTVLSDSISLCYFIEGDYAGYSMSLNKGFWTWTTWALGPEYAAEVQALHGPYSGYNAERAHGLFQRLLGEHWQGDIRRLLLFPEGSLRFLSFAALHCKPDSSLLLVEQAASSQQESLDDFLRVSLKEEQIGNGEIFALAPSYSLTPSAAEDSMQYRLRKELKNTEAVYQSLAWLDDEYGGYFCKEQEANEAVFKQWAGEYGILYLALHLAQLERQSALLLSFSPRSAEDDMLYSQEIADLELRVDFLHLQSDVEGQGAGLLALCQSFRLAGVRSFLLDGQQRSDTAALRFTQDFYEQLASGQAKDKALQYAQLQALSGLSGDLRHPRFWANSIQVGSVEPINVSTRFQRIWWYLIPIFAVLLLGYWSLRGLRQRRMS